LKADGIVPTTVPVSVPQEALTIAADSTTNPAIERVARSPETVTVRVSPATPASPSVDEAAHDAHASSTRPTAVQPTTQTVPAPTTVAATIATEADATPVPNSATVVTLPEQGDLLASPNQAGPSSTPVSDMTKKPETAKPIASGQDDNQHSDTQS
jgi:hypothetical protein